MIPTIQAIIEGSNIDVNNTNPYRPVVSVFIDEPLDMHGENLTDSTGILHLAADEITLTAGIDGGDIDISAPAGNVDIFCDNNLSLTADAGEVSISANSGNVNISSATADINVTAADGLILTGQEGVTITAINAPLILDSASSSASLTASGGNVDITSTNDNINLTTPAGSINLTPAIGGFVNITNGPLDLGLQPIENADSINGATIRLEGGTNLRLGDAFTGDFPFGTNTIAIGNSAGSTAGGGGQKNDAIAIGRESGAEDQGQNAIAIGVSSGGSVQGNNSVCVGAKAGGSGIGSGSVAIGFEAGFNSAGNNIVAIGNGAGRQSQGLNSIAIGQNASTTGGASSIRTLVLNASGVTLNPQQASSCYINPIRQTGVTGSIQSVVTGGTTGAGVMFWNPAIGSTGGTGEVFCGNAAFGAQVYTFAGATSITLTPDAYGKTYIFTGGATGVTLTGTVYNGWYAKLKNGNIGTSSLDVGITGAAGLTGNLIIHGQSAARNGGTVMLVATGTTIGSIRSY